MVKDETNVETATRPRRRRASMALDEFPAFRAAIEERLRAIERELAETKQRINALLMVAVDAFVTAATVRLVELIAVRS